MSKAKPGEAVIRWHANPLLSWRKHLMRCSAVGKTSAYSAMATASNAAKLALGSDAAEDEGWKVVHVDADRSNAAKLASGSGDGPMQAALSSCSSSDGRCCCCALFVPEALDAATLVSLRASTDGRCRRSLTTRRQPWCSVLPKRLLNVLVDSAEERQAILQ